MSKITANEKKGGWRNWDLNTISQSFGSMFNPTASINTSSNVTVDNSVYLKLGGLVLLVWFLFKKKKRK